MGEVKTYTGGCHCGKVRFEVDLALDGVASCNCSICSKRGWLLAFTPAEHFRLLSGADAVTVYQFNRHIVRHQFCATCGTAAFGDGKGPNGVSMVSINARCLDDVDLSALPVKHYDGRSL
ncbi:MAG: GFA family protein [Myxococcota bacterium]